MTPIGLGGHHHPSRPTTLGTSDEGADLVGEPTRPRSLVVEPVSPGHVEPSTTRLFSFVSTTEPVPLQALDSTTSAAVPLQLPTTQALKTASQHLDNCISTASAEQPLGDVNRHGYLTGNRCGRLCGASRLVCSRQALTRPAVLDSSCLSQGLDAIMRQSFNRSSFHDRCSLGFQDR